MAGFSETSPIQFAPYVPEINNDLALKIGMDKQQKYEQGIQRIQSNIDNVAGLDIANPVQQKYLQSKLNELGSNLKWVGAGDFSDFQLVNSVSGMTNQIGKDPDILNAVSSTAKMRKGFSDMEAAKKAGKSSSSNEYVFGLGVNDYVNNKDLKASFNKGYEEAVDVSKPLNEAFKNAHIDKFEGDEEVKNANGKINPDLLNHKISEGLSSSKVKEIAMSVFSDPKIARQLQIDGLYKYRNYNTESLIAEKGEQLNQQIKSINDQNVKLTTYASLASPDLKIQASKTIKDNQLTMATLSKNFDNLKELAIKNIDGAKYQLYLDSKLQDAVNQFGGINESNKQEVAPSFTVQNAKDHLNLERASLQERIKMDNASIENMHSEQLKRAFDMQLAEKKANGELNPDGSKPFLPITPPVDTKENEKFGSGSMYKTIDDAEKSRNQLFADFTNGIGIVVPGRSTPVQDFYVPSKTGEYQINPKYLNKDPKVPYLLNEEGSKVYNLAKEQLKKIADETGKLHTDSKVDPAWAPKIQQWYDDGTYLQTAKKKINDIEKTYKPELDKIKHDTNLKDNYTVTYQNPEEATFNKVNMDKNTLMDAALYNYGYHTFGKKSDMALQAGERLKKVFGQNANIDDIVNGLNDGGRNYEATLAFKLLQNKLKDKKTSSLLQQRETEFKYLQMQSQGNELKYNAPNKEASERMRTDMAALYANTMQGKSGGTYKESLSLLEKTKGDAIDNNLYKYRYDQNTGKWYGRVTRFNNGQEDVLGAEIEVPKGFVDQYNLDKQLDPKIVQLNNSAIGKTLNMNQGRATVNDVNSIDAYNSAFNRSKVGNYSVGFHVKSMNPLEKDSPVFIYLYAKDNKGIKYPPIQLDYSLLSKLPGMPSYISENLKSKSNVVDKSQILETISHLNESLNKFKDPNAAIKLLLNNSDKK